MLTDATRARDFPSLDGVVYLNTAAEGIPPLAVEEAIGQYVADKRLGMDGRKPHFATWEAARKQLAGAYGMSEDDVSICSCSSEAYNLVATALQLREGDEVVINDLDFPAGATPWLQPSCPAIVKLWANRNGALRVEDLQPLLGPRTRLVTVSMVSFYNGYRIPLPQVAEAVHRHCPGLLALDVTQALGRISLDLSSADLVISSTHKWILASHGGGLVGVPPHRANAWTVPAGGWFNLERPFDPDRFERVVSKRGAAGFTVGMPNFPAVYAINAALNYIQNVGVEAIDKHAGLLTRACLDGLKALPIELITPDEPGSLAGIISFVHPQSHRIWEFLHRRHIHIMEDAGRLRVAIHGYNTQQDIEQFLTAMKDACNHA